MNGRLETFHATYAQGQWFEWGEQPGLMKHLEGLGGGLPTDPPWQYGDPLLVAFERRQILAWIRGIPFEVANRMNAWDAWGIVGPAGSFVAWSAIWEQLRAEPDRNRLETIAGTLGPRREIHSVPPVPANLRETLESLYLSEKVPAIAVRSPDDLPLLAWAYLLGPVEWDTATVGPPRRHPLVSREPLTYQAQIVENRALSEAKRAWSSPLIDSMVVAAEAGALQAALNQVRELRKLRFAERKRRVLAPPQKPAREREEQPRDVQLYEPLLKRNQAEVDETVSASPAGPDERLRALEIKTSIVAVAVFVLLLLTSWNSYQLHATRNALQALKAARTDTSAAQETGTAGTTAAQTTTGTESAVTTQQSCVEWWTRPQDRARVLGQLRAALTSSNLPVSAAAARVLAENAVWNDTTTPQVLTLLVQQMDLRAAGCYTGRLDGTSGSGMIRAIGTCGSRIRLASREEALQRLCPSQP